VPFAVEEEHIILERSEKRAFHDSETKGKEGKERYPVSVSVLVR
jgi:hypothetical protein